MADTFTIYRICDHCQGVGTIKQTIQTPDPDDHEVTTEDAVCPTCNGENVYDGKTHYIWGKMTEDM